MNRLCLRSVARAVSSSRASLSPRVYHRLNHAYFRPMSSAPEQPTVLNQIPKSSTTPPKPKPNKSPSSLKRTAYASLPIRSNPNPTRGAIQPVYTYATAERFNLSGLQKHLPKDAERFEDAWWIPQAPSQSSNGSDGEVWVFGNGTIVCWGLEEDAARRFVEELLGRSPEVQFSPLSAIETEELEFVTDPAESTRLQGDLIILGQTPVLSDPSIVPERANISSVFPSENFHARYAFSQALARSTALSALETSLDAYLSSVELLPQKLLETGKPGLQRKEIIQKLGQLLKFRQGLNLSRENFGDTPDLYWAEPELEVYFNAMSEALEIRERISAVNKKITYAAEVQVTLRELLTESSAHRMELIIIALIAVEAALAIIRDGPDLWHMLTGEEEEVKQVKTRSH